MQHNSIRGITMATEKKSENTPTPTPAASDNKAVFAPLGKYAIVAVIMVSIIVTTAIMLDKQLNTIDEQVAAVETEIAERHAAENKAEVITETVTTEAAEVTKTEVIGTKAEATVETVETTIAKTGAPSADVLVAQDTTAAPVTETNHNSRQATPSAAQFELATAETSAKARQAKLAKEHQARIDAYKVEQKKNMSEMFARIKALESQQLDRYKTNQNGQITRLREQIAQQNKKIEALVLRNKDLYELRSANVQRNQANREQVLNRI